MIKGMATPGYCPEPNQTGKLNSALGRQDASNYGAITVTTTQYPSQEGTPPQGQHVQVQEQPIQVIQGQPANP